MNERSNGAAGMYPGDRVVYTIDGRKGVAQRFDQDGDAYVDFDDKSDGNVKWNNLVLENIKLEKKIDKMQPDLMSLMMVDPSLGGRFEKMQILVYNLRAKLPPLSEEQKSLVGLFIMNAVLVGEGHKDVDLNPEFSLRDAVIRKVN